MWRLVIVLAASLWAGFAFGADQPLYAPPPDWVKPIPIPDKPAKPDSVAVQLLLEQKQTRFGADGDDFFSEVVFRVTSPQGLAFVGAIAPSWNPQTETLTFHRFNIIRGGQTIDLLAGGRKVSVLRRETNLERAMLDGDLTASIQPEGVQVGDIIDLATTIHRHDPVYRDHSEGFEFLAFPGETGRIYLRTLWPASKPIRWRATDGMPPPVLTKTSNGSELVTDLTDFTSPKPPKDAPERFRNLGQMQITQFGSWSEVSSLMAPYYDKASSLPPNSPLMLEIARIRAASSDPKAQAEAALRLVQDQVRYTFIGLGQGGLIPADADVTWARRFGDCKGKTALLVAIFRQLGIEAEPALVSTVLGDGLNDGLPMLGLFDHVIARVRIVGKTYWLDGTRTGDRNIDDIATPDFGWVLPVANAQAQPEQLTPKALDAPEFDSLIRIDASAGLDAPATLHAEHILRGDSAVAMNRSLTSTGQEEADRSLREYWRDEISWADVKRVAFAFDDPHRTLRLTMDGVGPMNWTRNQGVRDFDIADSSLGFQPSFTREPGLHVDAPYAVPFPIYKEWTVVITLPERGAGFELLEGAPVDEIIAGRHFERQSRIEDGVVTMTASERTLAREFPASGADSAGTALRALYAYNVTVRANGLSEAQAPATEDEPVAPPVTAADFAHRGELFLVKRDYDKAIADFDRATRLDPKMAKAFYNRGVARFERGDEAAALSDFGQALRLNPDDVVAHEGRAEVYLLRGDVALAQKDFDEAARLSPGDKNVLLRHADAFESAHQYEGAVRIYSQLIAQTPTARFYNGRCWTRAEWGHELEEALADCDAALKLSPDSPSILDSRGLVKLRLGRYGDAIDDYDAALRLAPEQPSSLFGRGLAEVRRSGAAAGAADLAKARALNPQIDATYGRIGLAP